MGGKIKKILIVGGLLTMLSVAGLQMARGFIDAKFYRSVVEQIVREKTGQPLTIRGEASITLFPTPTITLPGIELRAADSGKDAPMPTLTADRLQITTTFLSLFSSKPEISAITLDRPMLEVQRTKDKVIRWGWLNLPLLGADGQSMTIYIVNGGVVYRNLRTDKETYIQDIDGYVTTGAVPRINGSLKVFGRVFQFDGRTEESSAGAPMPVTLSLSSDTKDALALEGTLDLSGDAPKINGKVTLNAENALNWFEIQKEDEKGIFDIITGSYHATPEQTKATLPIALTGQWEQDGASIKLTVNDFQGLNSAGVGTLKVDLSGNTPQLDGAFDFSALNYDYWKALAIAAYKQKTADSGDTGYKISRSDKENPLPSDITFSLTLNAKLVYFGSQVWKEGHFSATLDHEAVTVHQLDLVLPGDSALSLFGIISQSGTREMRFEGTMETQGKSMRELFTVFDSSALDLPSDELGEFSIRSNIYVAADQIRLSEADAKIGNLRFNGGLVAYYDTMPRLEADVRLTDINFDYFRDNWRSRQSPDDTRNFFLKFDKNQSYGWLKKFRASVDFKVKVDKFRFFDRDGDTASFRIFVQQGEFGIFNIRFNYPGDVLEAGANLDVRGEKPFFNVLINTGSLDTGYFTMPGAQEEPATEDKKDKSGKWSEDLIDMTWMDGWKGAFDISAGKLMHQGKTYENVKLRATLEDSLLGVQTLGMNYWGGKLALNGALYGGKVPGISVAFTLGGGELQQILGSLVDRDNIIGKISLSGKIATSGVNPLSWVSQAESELAFSGRGINVKGFNLQGVVDAVAVSRTASDVLNNVNLSLVKGATEMSVDGNINIKAGFARTPGINLKSGSVAGVLSGEIKLLPWNMQLSTLYQFPSMSTEKVPTMTVQIVGDVEKPEMRVDTASLEAYVAKRITGSGGH